MYLLAISVLGHLLKPVETASDSEVFYSSPYERVYKPSALWLGVVPRLLYNEVLLTVTVVWAHFIVVVLGQ